MSIKMTLCEGYWYVDVKSSPAGAFKRDSRHPNIHDALKRMEELAGVK